MSSYEPGTCWYDALNSCFSRCRFVLSGPGCGVAAVSFRTCAVQEKGEDRPSHWREGGWGLNLLWFKPSLHLLMMLFSFSAPPEEDVLESFPL